MGVLACAFPESREGKWLVTHWYQLNDSWLGSLRSNQVSPYPSLRLQLWARSGHQHLLHLHCPRAPLPPRNHLHSLGNHFPLVCKEMCLLLSDLDRLKLFWSSLSSVRAVELCPAQAGCWAGSLGWTHSHVSLHGQRLNKVWVSIEGWLGKGCWPAPPGTVLPKLQTLLCKFYLCYIHYWCLESSCRGRGCIVFLTTKCWWVKALSWAVLVLEGKMTLLLFQLIQVKLSRRGRRLKLVHLDQP